MILENVDLKYRMKMAYYVGIFAIAQYFLCLTNWNKYNSPQSLPVPFNPDITSTSKYYQQMDPPLAMPWVDMINVSDIWKKYLLIDKNSDILHSIMFETAVI